MRVLFIDIDSTNAGHLGCYGYHRNTSPNIDDIAKEGTRFTNYYTSDAPCLPSRTALSTGQFGIHNGVVGHGGTAGNIRQEGASRGFRDILDTQSFPALFRSAGMKTALMSSFPERHSAWNFYTGFNEIYNTGKGGLETAEEVTPMVTKWLEENGSHDDWFLYVNYWDPHTPYLTPEEFGNPFVDDPLPGWLTEEVLKKHRKKVGPNSAQEVNMFSNHSRADYPLYPGEIRDTTDLRKMVDGYDTGIRYVDYHIGKILNKLESLDVKDDMCIIVTADHGENMGEMGIYGEHGTADHATCRIPMIIRWPGARQAHVDNGFHYHLDIVPTIAEMMEEPIHPKWEGRSFASALLTGSECGRDYLVFTQCAHVCQRSVRFNNWLYIRTYHDGYHLFNKEMLFNLQDDIYEQRDLASINPDICNEGLRYLNEWHDYRMGAMSFDLDPLWTVIHEGGPYHVKGHLTSYIERLKETGREDAVPELENRYPNELD
ncbi:MAG TPA: sulfatase [Virgibacillus sp.]|nr:sulfatase [Virgibacillus sp.]HLR68412.1 sulfatase [Virgibacillus sp.]